MKYLNRTLEAALKKLGRAEKQVVAISVVHQQQLQLEQRAFEARKNNTVNNPGFFQNIYNYVG